MCRSRATQPASAEQTLLCHRESVACRLSARLSERLRAAGEPGDGRRERGRGGSAGRAHVAALRRGRRRGRCGAAAALCAAARAVGVRALSGVVCRARLRGGVGCVGERCCSLRLCACMCAAVNKSAEGLLVRAHSGCEGSDAQLCRSRMTWRVAVLGQGAKCCAGASLPLSQRAGAVCISKTRLLCVDVCTL